jgi:mRNA interferase RelE/StbE
VTQQRWSLRLAGPVKRRVQRLPEKIAAAVLEFILGPLLENPHRVGRALRGELEGLHAARVGAYRVIHAIDQDAGSVTVLDVDHRGDVYRPR